MKTTTFLVGLALCAAAAGQEPKAGKPADLPGVELDPKLLAEPEPKTVKLTVRPAAEPSPALLYRLLPDQRDLDPGNAALHYYRAFAPEWQPRDQDATWKQVNEWCNDLDKAPGEKLRWVQEFRVLKELDRAARHDSCVWEMTARKRREGHTILLGDFQAFRLYAVLLAARARFELAGGAHDKAAATFQTGLKLARDVAEAPDSSCFLVACALADITLNQVEHWMQAEGAPNLYWALANLPTPFLDPGKAIEQDRYFIESAFPGVRKMLRGPDVKALSHEQLVELVRSYATTVDPRDGENDVKDLTRFWSEERKLVAEARQALIAHGKNAVEVNALPALQASILYEVLVYERDMDSVLKWRGLPLRQALPAMREAAGRLDRDVRKGRAISRITAGLSGPSLSKLLESQGRLERRLALLRCVEALRLHAANNQGKWPPPSLDVVKVPLPVDPFTGKPFSYKVDGNKAVLTADYLRVLSTDSAVRRYEVTLKK